MVRTVFLVGLLLTSNAALTAPSQVVGNVTAIYVDDVDFGGCMAQLSAPINGAGSDCPGNWVSFSCTGDFSSKSTASLKLSAAQLAYVTDTPMIVNVDDSKKHNGVCFAQSVLNVKGE